MVDGQVDIPIQSRLMEIIPSYPLYHLSPLHRQVGNRPPLGYWRLFETPSKVGSFLNNKLRFHPSDTLKRSVTSFLKIAMESGQ